LSEPRIESLVAGALTPDAFAPFGVIPALEGAAGPAADLEFVLNDGWVNFIGHAASEVPWGDRGPRCDHLNRHRTHTQTLMPMDADTVIVVAPSTTELGDRADLEAVRAFLVRRLECVHLHRGTWHWGPYPVGAAAVRLFNVQGRGYLDDNDVAALGAGLGVVFEVDPQF
jgi:ureidoglycolate hydrolase